MTPIIRGHSSRLGLRKPGQVRLASISGSPRGLLYAVCTTAGKAFVVDGRGRAVHDTGVRIGAGQIGTLRVDAAVT